MARFRLLFLADGPQLPGPRLLVLRLVMNRHDPSLT